MCCACFAYWYLVVCLEEVLYSVQQAVVSLPQALRVQALLVLAEDSPDSLRDHAACQE